MITISFENFLKKKCQIFFIILLFLPSLLFSEDKENKILATVGTHQIYLSDFESRYYDYLISTGINDNIVVRRSVLNNMINEILLYYYDSNEQIFSDQEYLKELEEACIRTILAFLKDQEIYAKITVTEKEIRETFTRVNEKIAARHLYAVTEEEANELYELLKIGVSFESLASQVFTDSVLKNNGGYLGYFTWGDMDPAFEEAAYSLKIGEISLPVKTAQGYSIIKLEDRVQNPLLTEYEFQNKKSHLERVLKIRKKIPSEKDYINRIFDSSKLLFNNESLKNILADLYKKDQIESDNKKAFSQECAAYNERIYSQAEIEQKIFDLPYYHKERINSIETLKAAIEGILIKDILYSIAINKGYDSAEPVLSMIEGYKKNIFLEFKIDEITKSSYIPDSIVFNYYKNNINNFSNERELNLQEILVDDQNVADSLLKLISDGYDFGKLAKEFSLRKWSADNDGIMGFAPLSKFGSYRDLFWNTQIGEIIGPLKIENLYGIFRVLGKTDAKPIDLIKNEVTKAAQFENQTEIILNYIDLLRKKIEVKINNDLLSSYNIAG
ncbi:MAG: peptidylprolyl isomerase [Ignavibacteria bacterium]|nr:peptidylprolyl isomerase [Ignavibacteria bacterium]